MSKQGGKKLGAWLKSMREDAGYTRTEVAAHVGRTADTIKTWEEQPGADVPVRRLVKMLRLYRASKRIVEVPSLVPLR